jgi:hypothetical protein
MTEQAVPAPSPQTPSGAARLTEAKRIAKDTYRVARAWGSQAVPTRLQRSAAATTGVARLVVVGERKRGKSTLINALLSTPDLLPRDVDVATNTYIEVLSPRRIGRGDEPRGVVHLQSGESYEVDLADIPRFAAERGNPGNARQVAYVQVLLTHPLLDAGLVIVDTPGLGGLASSHGTMTLTALEGSDAVLLMLGAASPAASSELDFLLEAQARTPRVIVVESAGPEALDPQAVVAADRAALELRDPALASLPMLVVAPLDAHDALAAQNRELGAELRTLSNVDDLVQELHARVITPVLEAQADILIAEVRACLDELGGPDRALLDALGHGDTAGAADRARTAVRTAESRSPVATFDARFAELRREVDAATQIELARRRDELLDEIEDRWSASMAAALQERCRAVLADVATQGNDRLVERAGAIAAEAAERAGLTESSQAKGFGESPGVDLDLSGEVPRGRPMDHERVLGWLARGGPMLMIGIVTANPLLVGIGVIVVAASEQIQGASTNRRRAREHAQRVLTRGQTALRATLDERASAMREAFVADLSARHEARLERLRATVTAVAAASDVDGARRRVAEIDRLEAALDAAGGS